MTTLYLDRTQCDKFNAPYFEAGKVVVAADALLKSKPEYDSEHTAFLTAADEDTLALTRDEEDSPGWYTVVKVIPSFKRPLS